MKTVEQKIQEIKDSKIGEFLQKKAGLNLSPMMKRIVVKMIPFDDMPVSDKIDLVLAQYISSRDEKERGEGEMQTLNMVRAVIIFISPECNDVKSEKRQELIPGMEILMIPQTKMGYTTKMTIPHADGFESGTDDYYIINEHDVMAIIVDDQMVERKKNIPGLKITKEEVIVEPELPKNSLEDTSSKKILGLHD